MLVAPESLICTCLMIQVAKVDMFQLLNVILLHFFTTSPNLILEASSGITRQTLHDTECGGLIMRAKEKRSQSTHNNYHGFLTSQKPSTTSFLATTIALACVP